MTTSAADTDSILKELESLAGTLVAWRDTLVLGGRVALIVYDRCMSKPGGSGVYGARFSRFSGDCAISSDRSHPISLMGAT